MNRITLQAVVDSYTGYGELVCEVFKYLMDHGFFVSVRPIKVDTSFNTKIPVAMQERFVKAVQPEPWEILIAPPYHVPTPGKKVVYWTMWESTELPRECVSILNRAHHVVVPCTWNKFHFERCGVETPISVIPLGYKSDVFKYSPITNHASFGVAGRMAHGGDRKGLLEAIEAFSDSLYNNTEARLYVKCHADCKIPTYGDPRITIIREHMSWQDVADWFRRISVFVSAAKGEGFGLWQLQALASGRPVICCRYSGMRDFINDQNAYPVRYKEGKASGSYLGKWAFPEKEDLKLQMRRAFIDRKEVEEKGEQGAKFAAAHFTWNIVLKDFNLLLHRLL